MREYYAEYVKLNDHFCKGFHHVTTALYCLTVLHNTALAFERYLMTQHMQQRKSSTFSSGNTPRLLNLPPSLLPSLLPSLPPSFPPSLLSFLPPSLLLSLPPSLPPSFPPSLPLSLIPPSLPPSLSPSLPPSLPHSLLPSLPPFLPPSLSPSFPSSLNTFLVVVANPLLPDYWGESASVVLWEFAASFSRQLSSRAATPEGSLHKSRADSVVRLCGQLKRCCVVCS